MNRRIAIATLGAGLSTPALPVRAQSMPVVRGAIGGVVESFALPYYAKQRGFFLEQNLDVQLTQVQGSQTILPAIVAGQVDFGVTNTGAMAAAHVRGLPLYLLLSGALYVQASPAAHAVVAKNSSITSARELGGKTIGLNTIHDLLQAATMRWIERARGDFASTKWYELTSSELAAAVNAGRIDAAVIIEPAYGSIADQVKTIGLPYDTVNQGKPFQQTGSICNKDWADKNPDLARRLAKALAAASDWANKNPQAATELLAAYTKSPVEAIAKSPRVRFATKNDPGWIQPVIDLNAHYGFLSRSFSAAELYGGKTWV
jgi:NitT/TauT family transport system substrate-binding protein